MERIVSMDSTPGRKLARLASAGEQRSGGFHAAAVAVARLAAPVIAKRGGHLGRLKAAWPAVAGSDWAAAAWPLRLGCDGALSVRVIPAAALELQHRAPPLVERINLFLGGAVVARLVLKQAMPPQAPDPGAPLRLPTADETAALERSLAGVADPELRAALAGLGWAVLGGKPAAAGVAVGIESG